MRFLRTVPDHRHHLLNGPKQRRDDLNLLGLGLDDDLDHIRISSERLSLRRGNVGERLNVDHFPL